LNNLLNSLVQGHQVDRRLHAFGGTGKAILAHLRVVGPADYQDRDTTTPPDLDDCRDTIALGSGEIEDYDIGIVLAYDIKELSLDIGRHTRGAIRRGGYTGYRQILPRDNYCRCSHRSLAMCKWR
jgi:hypothetical protein